jgi:hypothetical protein
MLMQRGGALLYGSQIVLLPNFSANQVTFRLDDTFLPGCCLLPAACCLLPAAWIAALVILALLLLSLH